MRVEVCKLEKEAINLLLSSLEKKGYHVSDIRFDFQKKEAWILYHQHYQVAEEDTTSPQEGDLLRSAEEAQEKSWHVLIETNRPFDAM